MQLILESVDHACAQGAIFPAIVTALTIPDIAGSVEHPDLLSGPRYVRWLDQWFAPSNPSYMQHGVDSHALYALRCRLLHQGATDPSGARSAQKSAAAAAKRLIAFNFGPGISMHLCTSHSSTGESMTILRGETFCAEMTAAARAWQEARASDAAVMKRLQALVDIRFDVPPLAKGLPLICAQV